MGRLFGIGGSLTAPPSHTTGVRVTYPAVRQIGSKHTAYRPCASTGASFLTAPTTASSQPPGLRPVDSPDAMPQFLGKRLLLSFNPLPGNRSGLRCAALRRSHSRGCVFRLCSASIASPASHLLCPLQTPPRFSAPIARHPASIARSTEEASRGKTRYLHCIDAGFTKCTPTAADGGLRGHVPARPGCITPRIRFSFIAPQFRIGLPSDPASRRRPCPSPCLRLCEYLAIGLAPMK